MAVKEGMFELKLFVDGKQVGDSTDFTLWQSVYRAMKHAEGTPDDMAVDGRFGEDGSITGLPGGTFEVAIGDFANMLGIDVRTLKGACDPKNEAPFMHLDMHFWSNWTRNLPKRGPGSVGATPLAVTLLALWFRIAELGAVTLEHSRKILGDIGVDTKHQRRSIKNCKWLQLRGGKAIQINAAEIDKAVEVAKAFCEKRVPKFQRS